MNAFFIAGSQRSGTTLLSVLLSKHPEIYIDGNTISFRLISCFNYYKDVLPYNFSLSRPEIMSYLIENDYKGRLADLLDYKNLNQYSDSKSIIEQGIKNRLAQAGKTCFGDKAPNIEHFLPDLVMLIPKAKFIHIVRDGRAVAHSKKTRTNKNLMLGAQEWIDSNVLGLSHLATLGEDQYKIIRYEDLLLKPESTLSDICQFLDLPYSAEMIKEEAIQNNENSYVKSILDASKINLFKEKLSANQLKKIESIQGPMLTKFGYDLYHPISSKEYKQLPIIKRVWLSQFDNFKQLFISKRLGMVNRENIEISISISSRIKTFIFKAGYELLPEKVFKRLFRKRWIKNVYIKK
jgi:hypothetical protein